MMLTYQVEYTSRPDEREHVVPFGSDRARALRFARQMSDRHDGAAYVVVLQPDTVHRDCTVAVGHISYVFGQRSDVDGITSLAA